MKFRKTLAKLKGAVTDTSTVQHYPSVRWGARFAIYTARVRGGHRVTRGKNVLKTESYTVGPDYITCHRCGMTSHHPEDIKHRYCGMCHRFHDDY